MELDNLTPLQYASLKNMDTIASNGVSGLLDPIAPGVAPGSGPANLAILGYDPACNYGGRGPFEAFGSGIDLREDDIAFRCNFACVDEDFVISDERAGRICGRESGKLAEMQHLQLESASDVEVVFKQTLGFKGVLVLRGENLSANVYAPMPSINQRADLIRPLDKSFEAARTAETLNSFTRLSRSVLKDEPINERRRSEGKLEANAVIPWGAGKIPTVRSFSEKYGLKAACVAAVPVIKGIAKLAGMDIVEVAGATGDIDTDTSMKGMAAVKALGSHDFVMIHIEGPDEASHDGDVYGKIAIIKKIDSMISLILENVTLEDTCITLLADHTTSTGLQRHTGDPTPIAIACTDVVRDSVSEYHERAVYDGGMGRIRGLDVMPILLNLVGRMQGFGE
jgi:2,3-bisphosphoglycerate-independent phosphoglycerate mutase